MPLQTSAIVGHTPGPWRVIGDTDILALEGTPSSIVVASTKFFQGPSTTWERANAALIAAGPDLLEAARQFVRHHEQIPNVPVSDEDQTCVCGHCSRFESAIAKAEGREQ